MKPRNKPEVFSIVRDIIAQELDLIIPTSKDLKLSEFCDEIDLPVIISECNYEFGIYIEDGEAEDLETVEELVDLIFEKLNDFEDNE